MVGIKKFNKEEIGKLLLPEKIYKLEYRKELSYVYEKLFYNKISYLMITNLFFLSVMVSFFVYIYLYPLMFNVNAIANLIGNSFFYKSIFVFVTLFILSVLIFYLILVAYFLYYDGKYKKVEAEIEKALPEFLDNLVSNLKGGISLEKALMKSVRPEQEALLKEVSLINEKILMGKNVKEALKEFRDRFDSAVINRTFYLVGEGIKGGGNLAAPLERISQNLKTITNLDEEIKANASGFAIVISAITLFVAPLLFALSLTLLDFIGQLFTLLSETNTQLSFVSEVPVEFNQYLLYFSYAMIVLITFFSSLITSQLKNEKIYTAMKYLPFYIVVAISLFKFFASFMISFFRGII